MEQVEITVDDKVEIFEGETKEEARKKMHQRIKEISEQVRKQRAKMSEQPADGKKGFLLYNPFTKKHFFRIYESDDKRKFTDYKICAEDIEIEIIGDGIALYKSDDGEDNLLDWSSKVLGRTKSR